MSKKVARKHLQFNTDLSHTSQFSDSNEQERTRSFFGVAYSGKPIFNHPFWGNLIFDTSDITSKNELPILFNHDVNKVVGHGKLSVSDSINVEGVIYKNTQWGAEVSEMLENGFPMQESVYIEPDRIETVADGAEFNVNNQSLKGPFTIFRNSKIKEVSLTPLGADDNTSTHMFNEILNSEVEIPMEELMGIKDANKQEKTETEKETKQPAMEAKPETEGGIISSQEPATEPTVAKFSIATDKESNEFSDLIKSGDYEGAFAFACNCERNKKKSESSDYKQKYEELLNEFKEYKKKNKKKKRFSEAEDAGLKFSEEEIENYMSLEDDAWESLINKFKENKTRKFSAELFKADSEDDRPFNFSDINKKDPNAITDAANELIKAYKAEGKELSFTDAVKEIKLG